MKILVSNLAQKAIATCLTTVAISFVPSLVVAQQIKSTGASFPEILYERYSEEYQIVYNLQNVSTDIRLSRQQLAKIFTGEIGNWSQISSRLPNRKIQVVTRSDNSGTTFLLTRYLNKISEGKIAASRQPDWGFELYGQRAQDSGVAGEVRRVDGAIGYVQASFAQKNNLPVARIENLAGEYVRPTVEETKKALAAVKFKRDFTLANANESADDPEESRGFFNGDFSALGQVTFTSSDDFGFSFTYARFFSPQPGSTNNVTSFTGSQFAQLPFGADTATASNNFNLALSYQISDRLELGGWVGYLEATAQSSPENSGFLGVDEANADIWTAAFTSSYNDLGKLGSKLSFILGLPPKLTDNDIPGREDNDPPFI